MQDAASTLDLTFFALADPTRRAILARLAQGEASVTELVKPFGLSQPAISKHLKVLEKAGLISRGRDAQFRPCRLEAKALEPAALWLGDYRKYWEASLDNLERYVKELQLQEEAQQREQAKTREHKKAKETRDGNRDRKKH